MAPREPAPPSASPVSALQTKLVVGPARDAFEEEADHTAERVMRMPGPEAAGGPAPGADEAPGTAGPARGSPPPAAPAAPRSHRHRLPPAAEPGPLQRQCAECAEEEERLQRCPACDEGPEIRRAPRVDGAAPVPIRRLCADCAAEKDDHELRRRPRPGGTSAGREVEASVGALRGGGRPLGAAERSFFEPRFGADFSRVRIHTGGAAERAARSVAARAFTLGRDVVFGRGEYRPASAEGRRLLAHELTHVLQQRGARGRLQRQLGPPPHLKAARLSGDPVLERVFDGLAMLQNGDRGRAVRLIQESLLSIGFRLPIFGADGRFGGETETAVKRFQLIFEAARTDGVVDRDTLQRIDQEDRGPTAGVDLSAARFAGNATLEAVLDGRRVVRRGSRGTPVRLLQESMVAQDPAALPVFGVDGIFESETDAAVKRFQARHGADVDGVVGPMTMALFDQFDPGGTAATGIATTAAFSESPTERFAGFDVTGTHLVVPQGGRRRAAVSATPPGAVPSFFSRDTSIATVQRIEEGVVITGVAPGFTTVEARAGAIVLATLSVEVRQTRRTALPPGVTGGLFVKPNSAAVADILSEFHHLCPAGRFRAAGTDRIVPDNCPPAVRSSNNSCECLCDVTTDPTRVYRITSRPIRNTPRQVTLHTGARVTVPFPSVGPSTFIGQHPEINMPLSGASDIAFGVFQSSGRAIPAPNLRILAHELCGHGRLRQGLSGQLKGNRPLHDATIATENAIAAEHGLPARGTFASVRQGETFHHPRGNMSRVVFKLVDGWHFEPP